MEGSVRLRLPATGPSSDRASQEQRQKENTGAEHPARGRKSVEVIAKFKADQRPGDIAKSIGIGRRITLEGEDAGRGDIKGDEANSRWVAAESAGARYRSGSPALGCSRLPAPRLGVVSEGCRNFSRQDASLPWFLLQSVTNSECGLIFSQFCCRKNQERHIH